MSENKPIRVSVNIRKAFAFVKAQSGRLQLLAALFIVAYLMNMWTAHTIVPMHVTSEVLVVPVGMGCVFGALMVSLNSRIL